MYPTASASLPTGAVVSPKGLLFSFLRRCAFPIGLVFLGTHLEVFVPARAFTGRPPPPSHHFWRALFLVSLVLLKPSFLRPTSLQEGPIVFLKTAAPSTTPSPRGGPPTVSVLQETLLRRGFCGTVKLPPHGVLPGRARFFLFGVFPGCESRALPAAFLRFSPLFFPFDTEFFTSLVARQLSCLRVIKVNTFFHDRRLNLSLFWSPERCFGSVLLRCSHAGRRAWSSSPFFLPLPRRGRTHYIPPRSPGLDGGLEDGFYLNVCSTSFFPPCRPDLFCSRPCLSRETFSL